MNMTTSKVDQYQYARVSIHAPVSEIANCLERCDDGVLLIDDLPPAPFEAILHLLQNPSNIGHRLNQACPNQVVIYKDPSFGDTMMKNKQANVDRKCTLDISPDRLASIAQVDPDVVEDKALQEPMSFFQACQDLVSEKLIPALAEVIFGGFNTAKKEDFTDDVAFSYRMIDYYKDPGDDSSTISQGGKRKPSSSAVAVARPRLAEHRDFGFLTLIQASQPGLQVRIGNQWKNIPALASGTAILMGGWCAKIRTNNRLSAILHRVPKHFTVSSTIARGGNGRGPTRQPSSSQRISAVLFCNPKRVDTSLEPVVRHGETRKFIQGVTAATLQQQLAEARTEKAVNQWLECPNNKYTATTTKTRTIKKEGNDGTASARRFWCQFRGRR